ncbi:MAG: amidohydrolase family protein [Actinomycetota bacterium]|nr:amidohydrolase family protein [Actinomycetota bacterium]
MRTQTTLISGVTIRARPDQGVLIDASKLAWVGPMTQAPTAQRFVDMAGCLLLPAFVDAHVHATATGLSLSGLDLHGTTSLPDALERVAAHAQAHPGQLIFGTGWDETTWPERRAPSLEELDVASRGAAAYLARVDVHSAVVSTALLDRCPKARNCTGFHRDGHLRLEAHHVVRRAAHAAITPEQRIAAQRATRRRAGELGIAAIHEMAGPDISGRHDLEALLHLAGTEPGPEVFGYWGELGETDIVAELGLAGAAGDLFCDGAFGSHTAALHEPYQDAEHTSGALYFTDEQIAEHLRLATRARIQAGFHCIGDAAIDQIARGFEVVAAEFGDLPVRRCRHRLEHLEMPSAAAIATFARLGAVASVQPAFDAAWGGVGRMYETRLGSTRSEGLNPLSDLAAAGLTIAFGSDSPVTPINPWAAVAAAVGHRTPASAMSVGQAMVAATIGGWRATRHPDPTVGRIEVGAPAHLAVWATEEPLPDLVAGLVDGAAPPRCVLTVSGGRIIYGAGEQ